MKMLISAALKELWRCLKLFYSALVSLESSHSKGNYSMVDKAWSCSVTIMNFQSCFCFPCIVFICLALALSHFANSSAHFASPSLFIFSFQTLPQSFLPSFPFLFTLHLLFLLFLPHSFYSAPPVPAVHMLSKYQK